MWGHVVFSPKCARSIVEWKAEVCQGVFDRQMLLERSGDAKVGSNNARHGGLRSGVGYTHACPGRSFMGFLEIQDRRLH